MRRKGCCYTKGGQESPLREEGLNQDLNFKRELAMPISRVIVFQAEKNSKTTALR